MPSDDVALTSLPTASDLRRRLARVRGQAAAAGIDTLIIGPGSDLRYLLGHSIGSHERLSALVLTAQHAVMVLPTLERDMWPELADLGVQWCCWSDGADPYQAVARWAHGVTAVDTALPAGHALALAARCGPLTSAATVFHHTRGVKDAAEQAALMAAGAAIDRVHQQIRCWLRPGRTEREVQADIAAAMVAQGHARADFVIVGSGPHGAIPHHDGSDRVISDGDVVVIDIGGPTPAGYFSDCTRTYVLGTPADPDFDEVYAIVRRAQQAGMAAVQPGATGAQVDAAARAVITEAGYGDYFITRTGHGIGLEVHESPYIVAGNDAELLPGQAFSIEPGIYLPGRFGVRIEDIVIVSPQGTAICGNNCSKEPSL